MNRKRIGYILLFWSIVMGAAQAQTNPKEQLLRDIKTFYQQVATQKTTMEVKYQLYNGKVAGAPMQVSNIHMKLDKINKYIDNSQYTLYANKAYCVLMYKRNKVIVLSKPQEALPKNLNSVLADTTMLNYLKTVQMQSDSAGIKTYNIQFNAESEYKQWILLFDTRTNTIKKSTIYYKDDVVSEYQKQGLVSDKEANTTPIMVVSYTISDNNTSPDFFEATHIVQKKGNTYSLTAAYQAYRFYNQLNKAKKAIN
jgi:hypothetical protein